MYSFEVREIDSYLCNYQNYVCVELRRVNEDNAGWIVSIVDETGHGTSGPITCGMSGTEMPRLDGGTIPLSEIQCGDILMVYTETNAICESFPGQFAGDCTFAYVRPGEPGYVSSLADDPFFAGYGT